MIPNYFLAEVPLAPRPGFPGEDRAEVRRFFDLDGAKQWLQRRRLEPDARPDALGEIWKIISKTGRAELICEN